MKYEPVNRVAWHAQGLRWIGDVFHAAADRIERAPETAALPLEPTREYKPFSEFLYDARFRVQHDIFLR